MKFNTYELCNNDSTIRIVWNYKLKNRLADSLKLLKSKGTKYKEIANNSNIDYTTFKKYLKKPSAPLRFFKSLKDNYKVDLSKYFLYLEGTSLRKKVKIIKNLSLDLAKVLGAH